MHTAGKRSLRFANFIISNLRCDLVFLASQPPDGPSSPERNKGAVRLATTDGQTQQPQQSSNGSGGGGSGSSSSSPTGPTGDTTGAGAQQPQPPPQDSNRTAGFEKFLVENPAAALEYKASIDSDRNKSVEPPTTPKGNTTAITAPATTPDTTASKQSSGKKLASKSRPFWEIQEERRRKKEEAPVIPSLSLETATVSDPLLEA